MTGILKGIKCNPAIKRKKLNVVFKIKEKSEYGTLQLKLQPAVTQKMWTECVTSAKLELNRFSDVCEIAISHFQLYNWDESLCYLNPLCMSLKVDIGCRDISLIQRSP